jgi:arylsulfatase A-like enzyme
LNGTLLGRPALRRGATSHSWVVDDALLLDQGNEITIETPASSEVRLLYFSMPPVQLSVHHHRRRVPLLPAMPPTRIRYQVRPWPGCRLRFETFYRRPPARWPVGDIHFEVMAVGEGIKERVFSRAVTVGADQPDTQMEPAEVDLDRFAGTDLRLVFITRFEGETHWPMAGLAGWGRPRLLPPRGNDDQPPLIVWLVDTMRADHLSCYGYGRETTPNFDRLAAEGLRFEQHFSQSSWTRPSIASLLTGLYPSDHGAVGRTDRLLDGVTTLAEQLKTYGYTTAAFSSNGNFYSENWGLIRGFDEVWNYYVGGPDQDRGAMSADITGDLLPWLERHAGERVFLFIHTVDPHDPYSPPPPFDTRFTSPYNGPYTDFADIPLLRDHANRREPDFARHLQQAVDLYDGEIAYNDEVFGRVVEQLKETGFYDRSVLLVTSDHGEEFADHQEWGHGRTLFGEQVNIPLIIRLPDGRLGGRVVAEPVRQVDLMPSLLHWLGLPSPPSAGVNIADELDAGRAPATGEILAEESMDGHVLYSLIDGRHKYILRLEPWQSEELYDIVADPEEQHNLVDEQRDVARRMADRVEEFRRSCEESRQARADQDPVRLSEQEIANLKALGYLQ